MVSKLTTLFLGKPPRGSLPVFSAQSYMPVTDNLLLLNQQKRGKISMKKCAGCKNPFESTRIRGILTTD